jgi:hypothetical protein
MPKSVITLEPGTNPWNTHFSTIVQASNPIAQIREYYVRRNANKAIARNIILLSRTIERHYLPEDIVCDIASYVSGSNKSLLTQMTELKQYIVPVE